MSYHGPIKAVSQTINKNNESTLRKNMAKAVDFKILLDYGYPPLNFKKFKKGSKPNYNAQNKQMFGIGYNIDSEE